MANKLAQAIAKRNLIKFNENWSKTVISGEQIFIYFVHNLFQNYKTIIIVKNGSHQLEHSDPSFNEAYLIKNCSNCSSTNCFEMIENWYFKIKIRDCLRIR